MRLSGFLSFVILLLLATSCQQPDVEPDDASATDTTETIPFRPDGALAFTAEGDTITTVTIEIADTDSARARGLMQRESLPDQSAMLFIFPRERVQSFWMANTPLALDLFFVDADSQIVSIAKYTRPFSDESIVSEGPARFVIETPAGFADTFGIVEGNRVRWERE
jgi:hypothetical protein